MRQIILDTETTGLDPTLGHRIVELAAVEVVNRRITDQYFQRYLNPERTIDAGAKQVHGLTENFLSDKPTFDLIVDEFLSFISDSELIIHNAPFDVSFLNHELDMCSRANLESYVVNVEDSLSMAKQLHPGKRNSLDALCDRYKVNNSSRTLHGALLDSRLLAECYLAMTRGQESLLIAESEVFINGLATPSELKKYKTLVLKANAEELASHQRYIEEMATDGQKPPLWATFSGE